MGIICEMHTPLICLCYTFQQIDISYIEYKFSIGICFYGKFSVKIIACINFFGSSLTIRCKVAHKLHIQQ